ncbi:polyketide synthase family protein [Nostoc sp. PCC 7524]|uniref:type I polyketide synthase n=1 Tax=Nostoc sp. (strain ATCC 29411 / PCC 7524) TaxID=28072 RepID=UPI00029F3F4D|nr:type I polyketide synthase [Nostoc sp. PCC 7524]AFY50967.1 polyketide synthase family protein [Nostoc sp. PCC 7524]
MTPAIAIVGMACRYPDAASPIELWENVLAQRCAFRRMPTERLNLADYYSSDRHASDRTYGSQAAVLEGYEFDRVSFRVVGSTFRAADLAHWLALDIASQALADAGFTDGEGLPKSATGVILGNTLTGEFSRANTMRLRWPYVRRVVETALIDANWTSQQRHSFLEKLEAEYKAPFPEIGAETLAGNLSNTIAGRICNHFDLQGGGYTVDGACSSSLLAVTQACTALMTGDLDVALVGGVDLSLDPFELVGFAKAGALAQDEMRVYDAHSAGFFPGEGCGFVVLMRYAEAVAQQRRIYALIRGWGISSDGSGGITRPEVAGQVLALQHAYRRAHFGIDTVAYFEGHGTGTSVGDTTELQALSQSRREASSPAAIGSIKANIGHTKAAAGIAGLIKATMAIHHQILPPTTGCQQPHPELCGATPALRVLKQGQIWDKHLPLRAGVSAMGFGGINTHVVLEGITTTKRQTLTAQERLLLASSQDAELILMVAQSRDEMREQIEHLLTLTPRLSRAEVIDLAAQMAKNLQTSGLIRAAIAARNPSELTNRLEILQSWLQEGVSDRLNIPTGVFLGTGRTQPRIGFLFPGQGSPVYLDGGAWYRRFASVQELYTQVNIPTDIDCKSTAVAQPAIVLGAISGLRVLDQIGIKANIAVGHSLGELAALHWGGAYDAATLVKMATMRGNAMSQLGSPTGAMASIQASAQQVESILNGQAVTIAGVNSPQQTVISGAAIAIAEIVSKATAKDWKAVNLPVSHAFHSPLVAAAVEPFGAYLESEDFQPLHRQVISTVTGCEIDKEADLRSLLMQQITAPVQFMAAASTAATNLDLWIEVGPGRVLSGLVSNFLNVPVVALDTGSNSLSGLLSAVAAAFVLGVPINHQALFADRFTRPFNLDWQPRFLANPCELGSRGAGEHEVRQAGISDADRGSRGAEENKYYPIASPQFPVPNPQSPIPNPQSPLNLVRKLVAERTELPMTAVTDDLRLLSDLHLNSISVGQLVAEAARSLSLAPPVAPTHYADATVREVAQALHELLTTANSPVIDAQQRSPQGVDAWIRPFTVELLPRPLPRRPLSKNFVSSWQVITTANYLLTARLQAALTVCPGQGVVVCLPPGCDPDHIPLLLAAAKTTLSQRENTHFVLVQHGGGGAAFARTLYLEMPDLTTCVVDVPLDHPQAINWILTEISSAIGYTEAHYDQSGNRYEPRLCLLPDEQFTIANSPLPITHTDVLLITGGGKGIAAECALFLAKHTGVKLVLLGRSHPETDKELSTNLARIRAVGVCVRYLAVDVSDRPAVQAAVQEAEAELGTITAILHGAGVNVPQLISSLEESDFLRTLAPKVTGLQNLLAAIKPEKLRLLISFGSVIARTGLPGEADYALANEWLSHLMDDFQTSYPNCKCLNLEWSIWSGVGMGERLGRVDALMNSGITPISPDVGISMLHRLLVQSLPTTSVVVTGRFGDVPTLKLEQPELPLLRFLEHKRIYYPGVELVVDIELSLDTDPYLNDHVYQGERLFPGVMGLEAMAQAAMALAESKKLPIFTDVQFHQPVVISEGSPQKIRLAALVRKPGEIEVVLKTEQTGFCVDHFQATCDFRELEARNGESLLPLLPHLPIPLSRETPPVQWLPYTTLETLDPQQDLYGNILFQSGRFRRLGSYGHLRATECIAEITPTTDTNWFSSYLPGELVLGDPGARDTAIHALQACIPHATILPVGVERLVILATQTSGVRYVLAQERSHIENTFIYDLQVISADGVLLEQWQGLQLKVVQQQVSQQPWVETLLVPYLERQLQVFFPKLDLRVALERCPQRQRRVSSHGLRQGTALADHAIKQALGSSLPIFRRPDGKPEVTSKLAVSAAHAGDLTLAIAGVERVSCDLEPVVERTRDTWQELLGSKLFLLSQAIATASNEDQNTAATRVWTVIECLQKVGAMVNTPLSIVSVTADGWVSLSAGSLLIVTFVTRIRGMDHKLIVAILSNNARKFQVGDRI